MKEDKFIKYLNQFSKEDGDINCIQRGTIVEFEDEQLKIGDFLHTIRRQHKLYSEGSTEKGCASSLSKSRYEALDKLNFVWEPRAVKQEKDPVLDYIISYYDKHKSYEGLPDEVIIDGENYSIKNFIGHVRTNHRRYLNGENKNGSMSKTFIKRYKALDDKKFEWNPKPETTENDKPTLFLQSYYNEHNTLSGVPKKVEFEGEELNIESYLSERRKEKKRAAADPEYKVSKLEQARWAALDAMEYEWDYYEKEKQKLLENDPFIRYLEKHYEEHKTINDISSKQEVEFLGQTLKIGIFINDCRKKHLAYITPGVEAPSTKTPLCLKRYATLDKMGFDWRPSETRFSLAEHAKKHDVRPQTLKKNLKRFNGDLEKATKFSKIARRYNAQVKQNRQARTQTVNTVMAEFDVDLETLSSALHKRALYTEPTPSKKLKKLMIDEKTNLREYCINNGLNYTVIQKAIRLKQEGLCDEDLQSLINRVITEYNKKGQSIPSTWIYTKYGNETLVRHLILSMCLDPETILRDMSKNCISLENAIENNCFVRNSNPQQHYLEPLYHELVSFYRTIDTSPEYNKETAPAALADHIYQIYTEYNLTKEECRVIFKSAKQYAESIDTYRLYNVGFEHNPEKKVDLIIEYQLDDDEIESSFFMPLQFDHRVMIGRNSELYQRRQKLKDIIKSWPSLSEEERLKKIHNESLTPEELKYVTQTRREIDETTAKVHSKLRK